MKSKKIITKVLLLAFVISLVLPAGAFAADTKTASDLQGHWAENVISQWMTDGLVGGYQDGTFQPDKSITRAEFVKLINAAVKPNKAGAVNFSDVTNTDWFYDELRLAMGVGYANGFEDGTFRPADTVTRAQAAAFIAKAKELTQDTAQANGFTDSTAIAVWAKGAVGAVVKAGYMGGYQDGTFRADNALTRAEAVSMLDRVMKDQSDDLVITEPGTVVKDKTVAGDVIIQASVGSGDVTLDNVTIQGDLLVKGGGANSVHLKDTDVKGTVYAQRTAGTVRIVAEGASQLDRVVVLNGTHLQAAADFKGSIKEVVIDEQASSTQAITIDAKTDKIDIQANVTITIKEDAKQVVLADTAEKAKLTVTDSAKVETLTVNAPKATVEIASGAKVETLTANKAVDINGSGSIGKLEANASNVTTEIKPDKTETAPSVKDPVVDNSTSGGSSSGSSSSGGSSVKTSTVKTADELTKALADTSVDVIKVNGTIGDVSTYGTYTVEHAVAIKGETGAAVYGSFVVKADGVSFDGLTINNKYMDANTANKNGISAYTDKLTVTNCTFNANATNGTYEPNGLVVFPKTAGANGYTITGNTFNNFNNVANGEMYHSAGVFVAEGYPVNKKDFFGIKAATPSATVAAGVDQAIAEKNTFTNCAYGYVRMNGFDTDGAGVNVCYATVGNEGALANATQYAVKDATIIVQGILGNDNAYGTYTVDKAVTIKGTGSAAVYGSFIVKADGVSFDGLTINNKYVDNNSANKNGINAYVDKLTVTNCVFNAETPANGYEPNGLVIFPKTAGTKTYTVTGNTFNGFNYATADNMYHSAGVFVAEGYPVNKKDFFGVTAKTLSTTAAGVDEAIATGNTFTNCAYGYVRMNAFGDDGNGVNVCYATVGNEGALANAIDHATAQGTVILNNDVALTQMITIGEGKDFTLVLNGHTISNNITLSKETYRMFSLQGSHLIIDGSVGGSTITTGYTGNPNQAQMRLFQNLNGTLVVYGGSYIGYYAFESNIEASVERATTTISNAVITAGFSALSNFTNGTMNVSDSTITADYYVLSNNGLHGGTHFTATGCTMTSREDTAIYFPAGDELIIDSCEINAPKGSGIEAFAGNVTVKGNTAITAGAAKTEQVSANGEGSRMDGSAILIGYRSGYKTASELILNVADGVTLNSDHNGTIRLVQLGNLDNGITAITVTCPDEVNNKFINNIPKDTKLTVTINGEQVQPEKEAKAETQVAQENVVVNDEANTDPANADKNQTGTDAGNSGKDNGVDGTDDGTGTSAPTETPADVPEAE